MNITVYHVSCAEVKKPSVDVNGENLGFGQGFYLTNSKIEAEALARKTADKSVISTREESDDSETWHPSSGKNRVAMN